jgi:hypothetical protein
MRLGLYCALLTCCALGAAEPLDVVRALGSEQAAERQKAIEKLRALGGKSDEILRGIEKTEKLEWRALALLRRLVGETVIAATQLPALKVDEFTPLGAKKDGSEGNINVRLDAAKRTVLLTGKFIGVEDRPLEFLVVDKRERPEFRSRLHETLLCIDAAGSDVQTALLICLYGQSAIGADGSLAVGPDSGVLLSVQFEFEPAHADLVRENAKAEGKVERKTVRVPIESLIWNSQTEKFMRRAPFAVTGSKLERDSKGRASYMADYTGWIVALLLQPEQPYALMYTPLDMRTVNPQSSNGFYRACHYTAPPSGTPCVLVIEPFSGTAPKDDDLIDTGDKGTGAAPKDGPKP